MSNGDAANHWRAIEEEKLRKQIMELEDDRDNWKPVAENLIGHICPCKDKEPAMVEDKGDYVWRGITR